jgi:ribose/xylose/arabinose/galactoside ABC-type transport system permease subunit
MAQVIEGRAMTIPLPFITLLLFASLVAFLFAARQVGREFKASGLLSGAPRLLTAGRSPC